MALIMEYTNRYGDVRNNGYIVISNINDMKFDEVYNIQLSYYPNKQVRLDNIRLHEKSDSIEITGENYQTTKALIEQGNIYEVFYNHIKTLEKYNTAVDNI